ncbi:MAG: hypothetical protein D3916_05755 [Candidatus Electrothrix sp. MAN1_4]|nr:hypothetical protein [Candidatus Electrothrix sp. MAN1_4]
MSKLIRLIAVFEVIGGIIGILLGFLLQVMASFSISNALSFVAVGFFYGSSIYFGLWLFRGEERGYRLSIAWFSAQVPIISSRWIQYFFASGACLKVSAGPSAQIKAELSLLVSNFYLGIGSNDNFFVSVNSVGVYSSGINLLALMICIYLLICKKNRAADSLSAELPD